METHRRTKSELAFISFVILCIILAVFIAATLVTFVVYNKEETKLMEMVIIFLQGAITYILGYMFGSKSK